MRLALAAVLTALAAIVDAQVPDVRAKVDTVVSLRADDGGAAALRLYDSLGRTSTLALTFRLEPGFRAYIAQRLQRIPGDSDRDPFDEYYIEDEGIWRVGKQYLPFGSGLVLRESVNAARADTNLIFENLPISVAVCDAGSGGQEGVVGRFGTRVGLSFAYGRHFGIAGTALNLVRRPENSPGRNRGWGRVLGLDASRRFGIINLKGEAIFLSHGSTAADPDTTVLDVSAIADRSRQGNVYFGWSRLQPAGADFYRVGGSLTIARGMSLEPLVRYRDKKLFDITLSVRLKL